MAVPRLPVPPGVPVTVPGAVTDPVTLETSFTIPIAPKLENSQKLDFIVKMALSWAPMATRSASATSSATKRDSRGRPQHERAVRRELRTHAGDRQRLRCRRRRHRIRDEPSHWQHAGLHGRVRGLFQLPARGRKHASGRQSVRSRQQASRRADPGRGHAELGDPEAA